MVLNARRPWAAWVLLCLALAGCSARSGRPARIAVGYISHVVCSYVFVSGLDPARANEEDIAGNQVLKGFGWALSHGVDRDKRQVTARARLEDSRAARSTVSMPAPEMGSLSLNLEAEGD